MELLRLTDSPLKPCVVMLSPMSSGSSMVAETLKTLGVYMGNIGGPNGKNPRGNHEDEPMRQLLHASEKHGLERLDDSYRQRFVERAKELNATAPAWGFKVPSFLTHGAALLPALDEIAQPVLLRTIRPYDDIIASLRRHGHGQTIPGEPLPDTATRQIRLAEQIERANPHLPSIQVRFKAALSAPRQHVLRLARWLPFDVPEECIDEAVSLIEPERGHV